MIHPDFAQISEGRFAAPQTMLHPDYAQISEGRFAAPQTMLHPDCAQIGEARFAAPQNLLKVRSYQQFTPTYRNDGLKLETLATRYLYQREDRYSVLTNNTSHFESSSTQLNINKFNPDKKEGPPRPSIIKL